MCCTICKTKPQQNTGYVNNGIKEGVKKGENQPWGEVNNKTTSRKKTKNKRNPHATQTLRFDVGIELPDAACAEVRYKKSETRTNEKCNKQL